MTSRHFEPHYFCVRAFGFVKQLKWEQLSRSPLIRCLLLAFEARPCVTCVLVRVRSDGMPTERCVSI